MNYWSACRFANWLHNGQPTGAQGAGTTETGAYTLTPTGISNNTVTRNTGAKWAVTNEDEWYKAAYYAGGSMNAGYWDYPTRSNTVPGRDMADLSGNNANSFNTTTYPINSPYYTTVVGEFQNSPSPYGTFDQGGNIYEWNEARISGIYRGHRGGSFAYEDSFLRASVRGYGYPGQKYNIGFRVVEVPEPATLALLAIGIAAIKRRRCRVLN